MDPLRPDDPRQLGPYRLLRRVGTGGMGVVFLAVTADGSGDGLAAVKAVRTEYAEDPEFRARFAGEVELARRVRGPYTARVLDADTEGPRPWLATEYVSGPSLHSAVRDGGPFPESSLRALAAGLARALDAIHSVGLIHRDLKPSNVLLSARGPQVIDFGIARATDATALTRTGQTLGTPAFMSPEQATGAHLGPESDLFAFGGVLLFAGTSRHPFGTGDPAALLYRVVNEEPDLSGVPEGLLELVAACLAKAPADRPDLGSLLADLTGSALPEVGADDPTAWLPTAIATKVMGTVAFTRKELAAHEAPAVSEAPEGDRPPEGREEPEPRDEPEDHGAPQAPEAPEVPGGPEEPEVPEESGTHEAVEGRGERGAVEKPEALEGHATLPRWALTRPAPGKGSASEGAGEAEQPEERAAAERPREAATPAKSAPLRGAHSPGPALAPDRHTPVYPDPEPRGFSAKALWGTALSALVLVAGFVIILDPTDGRVDSGADASAPEESSSRSPRSSSAPEEPEPADIQEITWLSEDRFAVLSNAGVHLYETDQTEPVEEVVGPNSRYLGQSKLVTDRSGTVLAALDGGSPALVWDLDADEDYLVPLPEASGDSAPLALSPDGQTLYTATSGGDNVLAAYDVRSGEELYASDLPEFQEGYRDSPDELGTTPDGRLLIGGMTNGLGVWDAATGEPVPGFPEIREWTRNVPGPLAITDDLVATAVYEHLLLWNPWSQEEPESFEVEFDHSEGHPDLDPETTPWITSLSIADDGNTIVATGHLSQFHGFLIRWDRTGEILDEQWTDAAQYRAAQAPPSGEGVLVVSLPLAGEGQNTLTLLDDDLEPATEFELPTVRP